MQARSAQGNRLQLEREVIRRPLLVLVVPKAKHLKINTVEVRDQPIKDLDDSIPTVQKQLQLLLKRMMILKKQIKTSKNKKKTSVVINAVSWLPIVKRWALHCLLYKITIQKTNVQQKSASKCNNKPMEFYCFSVF